MRVIILIFILILFYVIFVILIVTCIVCCYYFVKLQIILYVSFDNEIVEVEIHVQTWSTHSSGSHMNCRVSSSLEGQQCAGGAPISFSRICCMYCKIMTKHSTVFHSQRLIHIILNPKKISLSK
jgi:hypothetical protein